MSLFPECTASWHTCKLSSNVWKGFVATAFPLAYSQADYLTELPLNRIQKQGVSAQRTELKREAKPDDH